MDYSRLISKNIDRMQDYISNIRDSADESCSDCDSLEDLVSEIESCTQEIIEELERKESNLYEMEEKYNSFKDNHILFTYGNINIPSVFLGDVMTNIKESGLTYSGYDDTNESYLFHVIDEKLWTVFKIKFGL